MSRVVFSLTLSFSGRERSLTVVAKLPTGLLSFSKGYSSLRPLSSPLCFGEPLRKSLIDSLPLKVSRLLSSAYSGLSFHLGSPTA